jgi:hypothetical protein
MQWRGAGRRPAAAVVAVAAVVATVTAVLGVLAMATIWTRDPVSPRPRTEGAAPRLENQATAEDLRATHDRFGIRYLQPTMPLGTVWVSKWDHDRSFDGVDPRDPWFDADHGEATYRVEDGQLFVTGEIPRMYVHDPRSRRQWRDVEMTMYFKRVQDKGVPYAGMTMVARSNHLETESGTRECDTRGIGARIRYDGHVDFEKETAFPLNAATGNKVLWSGGMPHDQWIGMKYVVYDKADGVHLQLWMDLTDGQDGGHWQLVNSMVDNGHVLGRVPCAAGIDPQLALTNDPHREGSETGLPNLTVYFRSDGVLQDGLVYKWGSVREIEPR